MTASAGAATAAPEELGAAVRDETAEAQAAIVIISRDRGTRETLHRELSKRYGSDYQIMVCDGSAELAPWIRDLRAAPCVLAHWWSPLGGWSPYRANRLFTRADASTAGPGPRLALGYEAVAY